MNEVLLKSIMRYTTTPLPPTQPTSGSNALDALLRLFIIVVFVALLAIPIIILWIWGYRKYTNSEYAQATNNSIMQVLFDKGTKGEFLLFQQADKLIEGERH